jgi:hypothetical protein
MFKQQFEEMPCLGHLSFSLNGANQINMSKLDKNYLRMLQSLVIIYQLFQ